MNLEPNDLDNDAAADSDLWAGGRQMLRQYLQEVGFTDTILDARSARLRALLGGTGPNDGKLILLLKYLCHNIGFIFIKMKMNTPMLAI